MIKLSKASKMKVNGKQVKSWDLEARTSCPGSKVDGEVVEVCKSCYATKGAFVWPASVALRKHNQQDYKRDGWVVDMVKAIGKDKYFRFFVSGDIETELLATKIKEVVTLCSKTQFWIPTRSYNIKGIREVLEEIKTLPNVSMRYSANSIGLSETGTDMTAFVINTNSVDEAKAKGVTVCPVTIPGSKLKSCSTCTLCFDTNELVAYVLH